ncbi:glycosyl hydrolase [Bifidobacterium lemurum]|uniref:Glycosyl hydrolase n=1 Tax=Bifidobacterium lemurum TaxID=1603886 RepID=A0A261FRC4_9BIFI|nr:glycoside hydrolase family 3 N-terminal domain-containing protein [Bifidobacterium lemurum]OZG61503.1 glycosyl hydrolase [Bifidobacterium lemurum]QOL35078.1 glycoside hydrolase family 3 C-terminal domain-containing protein [Bifidobacterium lemurum]
MAKNKVRKKMSNKVFLALWIPLVVILTAVTLVANVAIGAFHSTIENFMGGGTYTAENASDQQDWDTTYYEQEYDSIEEAMAASTGTINIIAEEGMVLLKNDGSLPLEPTKVTLLGRGAADPIYGGTGSGHTQTDEVIDIKTSLEDAGYEVNPTPYAQLAQYAEEHSTENGGRISISFLPGEDNSTYYIGEMPVDQYSQESLDSFDEYAGAGIVVIGRVGGEGGDLPRDMEGWDENYVDGQHILELNQDEKDQIALAKQHFDKVVVLVNASTSLELGELEDDPEINAIVQTGAPGATGFSAIGKILSGEVNPSGHTVDLFAADFTQDPTFVNFGNNEYANDSEDAKGYFVNYEEGIYYGYRYYETAAEEGFIDYDAAVVYPFGYGLSYTTFDWEVVGQELGDVDGDIELQVKVTNTGDMAGKDVVQMYYTAPYITGGIEKSHVVLGDFVKTDELAPGESQTITLSMPVEQMASYDFVDAQAYVMDAGTYEIKLQTDSHNLKDGVDVIDYNLADTVVFSDGRDSDDTAATNQFDDVSEPFLDGSKTTLSRADFAGTFPQTPDEADMTASEETLAAMQPYDATAENAGVEAEMPTTGADNDVRFSSLRGLDYDDELWDTFLDQLTVEEMSELVLDGAYRTNGIERLGKPGAVDYDGPAGFSSFINTSVYGSAFPTAVLIGQTWSEELAHELGNAAGDEAMALGINGWYAPAVNIHRSPFAGRNFEYYSEDPVLSGVLATSVVEGAGEKGVYTYTKHFALNDQETNRDQNGLFTWANEQTIREIYLKPFEIVVKTSQIEVPYLTEDGERQTTTVGALGIMSSFNRLGNTWSGGSSALLNNVLRAEWGFEGTVVTDMAAVSAYMSPDWGIAGGSDLQLSWMTMKPITDSTSAIAVERLRTASHNILYTAVNSNLMNGYAPGASMKYHPALWETMVKVVTGVMVLLIAASIAWMVIRVRRNRKPKAVLSVTSTGADEPLGGADAPNQSAE